MFALQPDPDKRVRWAVLAGAGGLALLLQGGALYAADKMERRLPPAPPPSPIAFTIKEVPKKLPPKPPEVKPEPPEPEQVAEAPPPPEVKPEPPKPKPKPKPKAKPKRKKRKLAKRKRPKPPVAKAPKPMPAEPAKPPPKPAKAPPKLIAGLSMSSTVKGGKGPAFGVGNTAMGAPDRVAAGDVQPAVRGPRRPAGDPDGVSGGTGKAKASRTPARLLRKSMPRYPITAREKGIEGEVVLALVIDKDGKVVDVRLIKKLGFGLDEAALAAARKTVWAPATRAGRPVRSTRRFNIRFNLEG